MNCLVDHESKEDLSKLSLDELITRYKTDSSSWDPKKMAEILYAIAMGLAFRADGTTVSRIREACMVNARAYAKECLCILAKLPADTLVDVAPQYTILAEVTMPNYLYEDYVRLRFSNKKLID